MNLYYKNDFITENDYLPLMYENLPDIIIMYMKHIELNKIINVLVFISLIIDEYLIFLGLKIKTLPVYKDLSS